MNEMTRPVKRSFTIKGHRTSISLEAPFWEALRQAAEIEHTTPAALIAAIDAGRGKAGLSSAVRVWVLDYFRTAPAKAATDGPRAGRSAR
jgi:predicted DNA-binding ribbon-helix-helix protein